MEDNRERDWNREDIQERRERKRGIGLLFLILILFFVWWFCARYHLVWADAKYLADHLDLTHISVDGHVGLSGENGEAVKEWLKISGTDWDESQPIEIYMERDWTWLRMIFSPDREKDGICTEMYVSKYAQLVNGSLMLDRLGGPKLTLGEPSQYIPVGVLKGALGCDLTAFSALAPSDKVQYDAISYFLLLAMGKQEGNTYTYNLDGMQLTLSMTPYEEDSSEKEIELHIVSDQPIAALHDLQEKAQKWHISASLDESQISWITSMDVVVRPTYCDLLSAPRDWDDETAANLLEMALQY